MRWGQKEKEKMTMRQLKQNDTENKKIIDNLKNREAVAPMILRVEIEVTVYGNL